MTLPAPNLDDRRFQDLVDDAKRLVQRRCPEWTDHNVSDPGITLIETFAYLVDQVLYRLNRVPERSYVTFLELMGVELFAPSAARVAGDVLADRAAGGGPRRRGRHRGGDPAPADERGDRVPHDRRPRRSSAAGARYVMTGGADGQPFDQSERAGQRAAGRRVLRARREPGDVLYIGLDRAVPNCAVAIHVECEAEGHGIDPTDPPWVWEALGADGWVRCDVEDRTGGFNEPGDVVVHVPGSHTEAVLEERSAGWLRCRIVDADGRDADAVHRHARCCTALDAATVGGTVDRGPRRGHRRRGGRRVRGRARPALRAAAPAGRRVGAADPGRGRRTRRLGAVGAGPELRRERRRTTSTGGSTPTTARSSSARRCAWRTARCASTARSRRPARTSASAATGPAAAASATSPPTRSSRCKSAIPFIGRVDNRRPAIGGVDGETVEAAKTRGPLVLGTRNRAVTARDYEQLAREATPEVARVRCLPVDEAGRPTADAGDAGGRARARSCRRWRPTRPARITFDQLVPPESMMATVRDYLDERRMVGARVVVTPPRYLGVTAVIRAPGPLARRSRRGPGARRSTRCTATSTRCAAGPTATAGRSAGRSCSARCSASPSASTAST